jgi:hypothetical protein
MERRTKREIEQSLLAGREIEWVNSNGNPDAIELGEPAQRRLFDYLLRSKVREAKVSVVRILICPLQSGPFVDLDWTLKETEHGQEARA